MTLLLRYVLEAEIGRSANGVVYRARQRGGDGRTVAVKRLHHAGCVDVATAVREAEVLGALGHPNIVPLLEVAPEDQGVALVFAYAAGGSLADELGRAGRLTQERLATVILAIASALQAAHALGVVHGEVKPANVVFSGSGEPLLADFGAARWRSAGGDQPTVGAATYLDPALLDHPQPHPTNDLYGLAVTCFEALAGVPPLKGATAHEVVDRADRGDHADLRSLAPQVRPQVAAVVQRALARHPRDRYQGVAAFAAALREALDEPPAGRGPVAAETSPAATFGVPPIRVLPTPAGDRFRAAAPIATAPVAPADGERGRGDGSAPTRRGRVGHTDAVTRRRTGGRRWPPSRVGAAALAPVAVTVLLAELVLLEPAAARLAVALQAPPALLVLGCVSRRWSSRARPTSRGVDGPHGAARSGCPRVPEDRPPPGPR